MKRLAATLAVVVTLTLLSAFGSTTSGRRATLLAAQAAPPDAVAADPARYSVLYENIAQMIRVKYQAGAKSVMHSHPAGCAIFYKDATLKTTSSTGEVRTRDYRAGDVTCGDAYSHIVEIVEIRDMETGVKAGDSSCGNAMAHESPNNAKSVNEAITIEFKNRDSVK
jgi:hypothetical protein